MAKSARASGIKKNKAVLKRRVFGPVETARNERLSAKLLQLAQQPKPKQPTTNNSEIDLETEDIHNSPYAKENAAIELDEEEENGEDGAKSEFAETGSAKKSKRQIQRQRAERTARIDKKRKPRNVTVFHTSSGKKGKGKR